MDDAQIQKELRRLELQKQKLMKGLPHRYAWKWYEWAYKFYTSTNRMNMLTAANQISKSSTQIRKCIEWSGNKGLWPKLWKTWPRQYWYLYPTADVATIEFEKKWVPEFMPIKGNLSADSPWQWKANYEKKKITSVDFASGVTVFFKTYSQNVMHLQTGTVHAIFCDEELPEDLYDELAFRLEATDGYFHMVFTATLNQLLWWQAMEGKGKEEKYPDAFKQQISMYDCRYYMDGTPAVYHDEKKIERAIARCRNENEVKRRVFGKFVSEGGRKYPTFVPDRHYKHPEPVPKDWNIYSGVDIGSGGSTGHPSAICFVAVSPDLRSARVFRGWRGDNTETTSGDVLKKYRELKGKTRVLLQCYDYSAKDFFTIATRQGENFVKAEKSHEIGEDVINTLFQYDMLTIDDTEELRKLGSELISLMSDTPKRKAKDDFIDAMRYALTLIPFDWEWINETLAAKFAEQAAAKDKKALPLTKEELKAREIDERRGTYKLKPTQSGWGDINDTCDEWNEAYGN
jgi:phage terminase large subunit-like protein